MLPGGRDCNGTQANITLNYVFKIYTDKSHSPVQNVVGFMHLIADSRRDVSQNIFTQALQRLDRAKEREDQVVFLQNHHNYALMQNENEISFERIVNTLCARE